MSQGGYMISVVFVKNPFDTSHNQEYHLPFIEGNAISMYTDPYSSYYPDTEFHISLNGHALEKYEVTLLCPTKGDQIVIMPIVGKSLGALLGSIATMWLTSFVTGPNFLPGMKEFAKALVQGVALYVGGRIINAILPPPKQNLSSSSTSPTYSWEGTKPIEATGTPVGKTFGTVSPTPVILARHVTVVGDKQYLNILYGGGEGPVDFIDDITIDGNPIGNYSNVEVDIRLGTNDQEPILNFGDTYADQELNYELQQYGDYGTWKANTTYKIDQRIEVNDRIYNCRTGGKSGASQPIWPTSGIVTDGTITWIYTGNRWATQQTEGNAGRGLEITFNLPYGLYHTKDDGSLENATVKMRAQYRKVGAATWIEWEIPNQGIIAAAKNTAVYQVHRLDKLDPAQYEVRCQCYYKQGTDTRFSTRVYWSKLSHIMYNDFARPNKVLVGIKALATDQLSGADPNVKWKQGRSKVYVWNKSTNQYEQKPATNPYWACYDLIHNCKYMKNINTGKYEYLVEGNPINRIDYPAFLENATYSGELVDGEPRFELNLYLDTEMSFWDALARMAVVGRGVIIPRGTKYSCICDKPTIPTQLFTMGNITEKSLKGKFQSTKDRSQCIEVDFFNEKKDYKQDLAVYFGDEYNTTTQIPNPTKVTRYGITKYKHAYKEAVFLYKGNKYLKRTVTWEADIDAIACKPGDVILLQHNVPKWGAAGGRIVSATANTVTLDQKITLLPGKTYAVEIRLKTDARVNRVIKAVLQETITDTLTLAAPFTEIPERYDIFAFGESYKVTKPFKVINIVKSKELRCKLTGVEYIEDMYSDVIDIPVINYSDFDTATAETENLSVAEESFIAPTGDGQSNINLSWTMPRNKKTDSFMIYLNNGTGWQFAGETYDTNFKISNVVVGYEYQIRVAVKKDFTVSIGVFTTIGIIGNNIIMPNVSDIVIKEYNRIAGAENQTNEVIVSWQKAPSTLYDHAEVYIKSNSPTWAEIDIPWAELDVPATDVGIKLNNWRYCGSHTDKLSINGLEHGNTYQIKVVACGRIIKANFENSPVYEYAVSVTNYPPAPPENFTVKITDQCEWSWSASASTDFYELRTDQNKGENDGMLWQGNTLKAIRTPNTRKGTAYLYAHNGRGYSDVVSFIWEKSAPIAPANVTIKDVFQGIMIACDPFPPYCLGINIHINDGTGDKVYFSQNNNYTFKAASGIFDIQVAFVDIFGEGSKSAVITKTIKATIDPDLLAAESLSLEKMDAIIKDAVKKAQQAVDTTTFNENVNRLEREKTSRVEFNDKVNELIQIDANNASAITQTTTTINATIVSNKTDAEGKINKVASDLTQTSQSLTSTIQSNKTDIEGKLATTTTQFKQTTDGIVNTVQTNKTNQDGVNVGLSNQITQQANQTTSIITELNKPLSQSSYTSIVQALQAINLRVTSVDFSNSMQPNQLITQINLANGVITLDGKLVHITGNTLIDANVIVNAMLSAKCITADKIAIGAITAEKIAAGAVTAEKISATLAEIKGKLTAAQIDAGVISADKITTGILSADLIYSAGYQVKTVSMVRGEVWHGGTIPLPIGYTEEQCVWGVLGLNARWDRYNENLILTLNTNRVAYAWIWWSMPAGGGETNHYNRSASLDYWIMGVK
jgi:hypothetical protein